MDHRVYNSCILIEVSWRLPHIAVALPPAPPPAPPAPPPALSLEPSAAPPYNVSSGGGASDAGDTAAESDSEPSEPPGVPPPCVHVSPSARSEARRGSAATRHTARQRRWETVNALPPQSSPPPPPPAAAARGCRPVTAHPPHPPPPPSPPPRGYHAAPGD